MDAREESECMGRGGGERGARGGMYQALMMAARMPAGVSEERVYARITRALRSGRKI